MNEYMNISMDVSAGIYYIKKSIGYETQLLQIDPHLAGRHRAAIGRADDCFWRL